MPWWTFGLGQRPRVPKEALSAAYERALTSAATPVASPQSTLLRNTETWQDEAWRYYDTLGEFNYAVTWMSAMQSRVRLFAAELVPGQDEPVRLEDGLAVDIMNTLAGGVSGQTQMMASLAVQLAVPGEGYLVGETVRGVEKWTVRSIDEVQARHGQFEVKDETATNGDRWRPLVDGVVVRIHRPHKRWFHMADSSARSARSTMRELELVNRHILAQYLSRLASAGIVIFPDEVMFPVREEFAEANDPFMAEWIELAATAIREPGAASAVIPLPMRVPGEWVDKIKHVDFTLKIDEKVIEKRESAIKRLATQVNIPAEVLLGMGDVNHWGQWQITEEALKTTIAPDDELIASALTTGYLQPRLAASGEEDVSRFVVWYDLSELAMRPDKSDDAILLYDRLELSGEALRREAGFDESDKPTDDELKDQGLKTILRAIPAASLTALAELTGEVLSEAAPAPETPVAREEDLPAGPENGPPSDGEAQDVPDDGVAAAAMRVDRLVRQARAPHAVRFGLGGRWELLHPEACDGHTYSCPFMQAALKLKSMAHPGRTGLYECSLDPFGRLRVGDLTPHRDVREYRITRSVR